MPSAPKMNHLKGLVICHGKSEVCLVKYITTNLHLNVRQYSKNNGKYSIQITGLMDILKSKPFDTISSFTSQYAVEVKGRGKNRTLNDFKLFIIMDTDDCSAQQKKDFISKKMFEGHWLYDYIVPIHNSPSLEDVLLDVGIMAKRISDSEKGTYYEKIFPINSKPLSNDTMYEVQTFKSKIGNCKKTNILNFINYCLSLLN